MSKKFTVRAASLLASAALLGGTAFFASGATGAYFSDTHDGSVTGTIGNVHVTTFGGGATNNLTFNNLLPGEKQTVTLNYTNTGSSAEDIYLKFNNSTALSALNDLGKYGEVHIAANGVAIFDSINLKDQHCGDVYSQGANTDEHSSEFGKPLCWPLRSQYLLASNVAPGQSGSFEFSFNYSAALSGQAIAGANAPAFNSYPVTGQATAVSGVTGAGLPFQVIATQRGITP
jgi:hypothetical protein